MRRNFVKRDKTNPSLYQRKSNDNSLNQICIFLVSYESGRSPVVELGQVKILILSNEINVVAKTDRY